MTNENKCETTLALIKPEVAYLNYQEIFDAYKALPGLAVVYAKRVFMNAGIAEEFYAEHVGKGYFPALIDHMISGPSVAIIIHGPNAIEMVRKLNGTTNPADAEPGTLRARFGTPNGGPKNAVHSSANLDDAHRELSLVFGDYEIHLRKCKSC